MDIISEIERERMNELLQAGKRIDGRGFDDLRPIKIVPNIVSKAEGSAEAWLGETRVITGMKVSIGQPFPDTPNEGVVVTSAELSPIGSPSFELGPPGEQAIELARVVDRGIRHSNFIQRTKLCIAEGTHVYLLFLDIYILADHGNLIDASHLSAVATLMTSQLPKVEVDEEGNATILEEFMPLEMEAPPIALTFAKINDSIVVDPISTEELVMSTRLSITIDGDDTICSMQKSGSGTLTRQEILDCVERACQIVKKARSVLPKR
ncbi:MAG: exosome complex protein Rrp42 [Promethearchaeota archaeon]